MGMGEQPGALSAKEAPEMTTVLKICVVSAVGLFVLYMPAFLHEFVFGGNVPTWLTLTTARIGLALVFAAQLFLSFMPSS